ncbi:hypothetical protein WH47_11734, partial [Habropoda laboriosa]
GNESVVPEGWPLTLGRRGLVLQLGELEASALRLGECYLCIRSAAAVATTSGSGEAAAGETVERNTVEIAVVWRTTSMRAPGFLGWDREEEFMDWREVSRKGQGSSSAASNSLSGSQSSSIAKMDHEVDAGHAVMKSRSTSSVGTWKPELEAGELKNGTSTRASSNHSSSLSSDECRAKVKRCAKVVSSTTMEKWKETARCETRSKILLPDDLKTPLRLDEAVLEKQREGNEMEDRLQSSRNVDEVGDDELPAFIGNLLVSVERKIERVSLDDLTFPCPACRNIDTDDPLLGCRCAGDECGCGTVEDTCDCSSSAKTRKEQSTRSFEIAGIKHIDSDDEEEVRMGFGE